MNNTNAPLLSFVLNGGGVNIFGFDTDGIDTYTGVGPAGTNPDKSTYGGPNGFFTNISGNVGTVNFANGGIPAGGSDFFSLEEAISLSAPPVVNAVPEPASMLLLGAGLAGLGAIRRRTRRG